MPPKDILRKVGRSSQKICKENQQDVRKVEGHFPFGRLQPWLKITAQFLPSKMSYSVSSSTLLRLLHRIKTEGHKIPKALGVDDWAYKKGGIYGTILVDLEERRPIDLLPDRTASTLKKWLLAHPGIKIISRDRSGAYAEGARQVA